MKRKKKSDNMNISNKEKEILKSYNDISSDASNIEEFEVTTNKYENTIVSKENKKEKNKKLKAKKHKTKKAEDIKEAELLDSILEEYEIDEAISYDDSIDNIEATEKSPKEKKFKQKRRKEKKRKPEKLEEFEITNDLDEYDTINDNIEEEYEFVEEEHTSEDDKPKNKRSKINIIINIIFGIIILLIILSVLDIVSVVKYEKKPHFAIPVKTYDDGGSKEYLGLGYKVIKYNQVQGRRDIEIGTWSLKYNIDPIYLDTIDLAIEATENEAATYEKYYKKFLRINGILNKIDIQENTITVSYIDEGKKYNFDVICNMATSQDELTQLEINDEVTVLGTMKDYTFKSKDNNSSIKLDNCFAEQ